MTDFQILAQLSSDALLVVAGSRVAYANPAAQALLAAGAHPEGLQGRPVQSLWQPDPLQSGLWSDDGQLPTARVQLCTVGDASGEGLALELCATRSHTPSGPVYYVKARRLQGASSELAGHVRTALTLSPDPAMVVDAQSLAFLEANTAACTMMGMPLEAIRARGPTTMRRRDGSGKEDFHALYAELVARAPQALTHEYDFLAEDGRVLPVAATRQALNVDGRWLIFITWRDISQRIAAQEQRDQFEAAFDQATDAICIVDVQALAYLYFNDAFQRLAGISRQDIIASGPAGLAQRFGPAADVAALYADIVARHPETVVREEILPGAGGERRHLELRHRALHAGGRWLVLSTRIDVTERKRQQERAERFAAILNLSSDGVLVINRARMAFVDVNDSACRLYGYSREDLLALPPHMNRPDLTLQELEHIYDATIANAPQVTRVEFTTVRRDGSTFRAEVLRQAIPSDDGWLIAATVRDLTERKAAQVRLELLREAFNAAPDAIVVIDPETLEYVDVNEAAVQLVGIPREQLMRRGAGTGAYRGMSDEELKRVHAGVVARAPEAVVEEHPLETAGRSLYVEFTRRAVNVEGRWLIVSVNRDITERRAAQARMELLVQAFNAAPDPIVVVDPERMTFVDVNEAATRLVGRTREEMLALGLEGVFPQELVQDGLQNVYFEAVAAAPNTVTQERLVFDAQGLPRVLEGTRRASKIDGRWVVVSVTRDITERKAAQARVERFAAMVNLSTDAALVVDRATLRIIDVNEAACQLYRCSREELLSRAPNANRSGMSTAQLEALYDETIARAPEVLYAEHEGVRADGSTFFGETHRIAIRGEEGWLILATVRDVTERKQAGDEIQQRVAELELLREAYDAAVDAILIADPDTLGYLDVNQAAVKLLGVSREDLLAGGVESSYYSTAAEPFNPERLKRGYQYVISRAPEAVIDVRLINPLGLGGRDTVIEFSRRAVNIQGRWVIVTMMRDITAAKRAEEEIRQHMAELTRSNHELEQFAYITSHDLSEPLRMVASYTQLLAKRYGDKLDDDGREFVSYAVDGTQRMKRLIDDLLLYSRAGRANVQMRRMRLDLALDDALANLANAIERNGAVIERTPLPELVCQRASLTQVFQNLVGNAIKFRGEAAPVVRISAVDSGNFWTISVADNGIGIPSEHYERIFQIFQRLHARAKYEGTGIGLSICKKIVERHGGQITVTSAPGQGTVFSFTLSKTLTERE